MMAAPRLILGQEIFDLDEVGEVFLAFAFLLFAWKVFRRSPDGLVEQK